MRQPVRALWLLALASWCGACSDIAATNPYDPETPLAQQTQGSIRGMLVMPEDFDGALVTDAVVTLQDDARQREALTTPVGGDGAFTFDGVPADAYTLRVNLTGFSGEPLAVTVPIGGEVDVGEVALTATLNAALRGRALRPGEGVSHSGILVEVVGTPFTAITTEEGRFQMTVTEGTYTVRASAAGFTSAEASEVTTRGGETVVVGEPLQLQGAPGLLRGTIKLRPDFDDEARLATTTVEVYAGDASEPMETLNPTVQRPSPDGPAVGTWVVPDLTAGPYRVRVNLEGFYEDSRTVDLPVGADVDLGEVVLFPQTDDAPGAIEGRARLSGQPEDAHGSILVAVEGTPFTAITSPSGEWRVQVPAGTYVLTFTREGHGTEQLSGVRAIPGQVEQVDMVVLAALPGAVDGSVALGEGFETPEALQRVDVALLQDADLEPVAQANPDARGRYTFDNVAAGDYAVRITRDGFEPRQVPVSVIPGRRSSVPQVVLEPVAIRVQIQGTARVQGRMDHSEIQVRLAGAGLSTETNAQGRFTLDVPLREAPYELRFNYPDHNPVLAVAQPPSNEEVDAAVAARELPIVINAEPAEVALIALPGSIRGSVSLEVGFGLPLALPSVDLALLPLGEGDPLRLGRPDAQGAFVFEDVPAGAYRVEARLDGFVPRQVPVVVDSARVSNLGQMVLSPVEIELRVQGIARVEGQMDHSGVVVSVVGTGQSTETNAQGLYALDLPLREAEYVLRLSYPAHNLEQAVVAPPEAAVIDAALANNMLPINVAPNPNEVVLQALPGAIRGSVTLEAGFGAPEDLPRVDLALLPAEGDEAIQQARPDAQGAFVFADVPAGRYRVEARLDGFTPRQAPVEVDAGRVSDVGQLLLNAVEITVSIQGTAQFAGRDNHLGIAVSLDGTGLRTETAPDGSFILEAPLRQAAYTLTFSSEGYNNGQATAQPPSDEAVAAAVEAAGGASPPPMVIQAAPRPVAMLGLPGRIRGRITLAAGFEDPVLLAQVAIRLLSFDAPEAPVAQVAPDPQGFFVFDNVPAGDYVVTYNLASFLPQSTEVTVGPGGSAVLAPRILSPDIRNTRSFIEGVVERVCALPPCDNGGIRVEALNTPFVTLTNQAGQYRLEVVEAQDYTLEFNADGYLTQQRAGVDTVAGEITLLQPVQLEARRGRISTTVALRGFSTVARLQRVDVSLFTDPPGQNPVAQTNPDAAGGVIFDNLVPGRYLVRVDGEGYDTNQRSVEVDPGEAVDLGLLDLSHQSETASRVTLAGTIALNGEQDASGTGIQVEIVGDDLALGRPLVTDANGRFAVDASPEERYRVIVTRAGWEAIAPIGPLTWDANDNRFETGDGQPINRALNRIPIQGRIDVTVGVFPDWLPIPERQARVRLEGAVNRSVDSIPHGAVATFDNLPEGNYTVTVERPGFSSEVRVVEVTPLDPVANLGVVSVRLLDLALASPDMQGQRLDACDLREGPINARGADLSGVALTGNFAQAQGCVDIDYDGPIDLRDTTLIGADLRGASFINAGRGPVLLDGANLSNANLAGVRLNGVSAPDASFFGANMVNTVLAGANLTGANFFGADLAGASITRADLRGADLFATDLSSVSLVQSDLSGADFVGATLVGGDLREIRGNRTDFSGADLSGADLSDADLTGAAFDGSTLLATRFVRVRVDGNGDPVLGGARSDWPDLVEVLDTLPQLPCTDRRVDPLPGVVLTGASFARADMAGVLMPGVDLSASNMAGARLVGADLRFTCLENAQLTLIDLSQAILDGADAFAAEFTGSLLRRTRLRGTTLVNASLVNTVVDQADIRLSPAGFCPREPLDWVEYEEGGRCADPRRLAECRCRTLLTGAALDGANLIGTSMEGADLADATMLGVTFGRSEGLAVVQPPSCLPPEYFDCAGLFDVLAGCGRVMFGDVESREEARADFLEGCQNEPGTLGGEGDVFLDSLNTLAEARCILDVYASDGCNNASFNGCLYGPDPNPPPQWPDTCTWEALQAQEANPALPNPCELNLSSVNPAVQGYPVRDNTMPICAVSPTVLVDTRLDNARMTAVVLNSIELRDSSLQGTNLRNGIFIENRLLNLDFTDASFIDASLTGADLTNLNLTGADFSGAVLRRADLSRANLTGAVFDDAEMGGTLLTNLGGAGEQAPASAARVDFSDAEMDTVNWPGIDLSDATFRGVLMRSVTFDNGNLSGAEFSNANMGAFGREVSFVRANLGDARFSGTYLDADFRFASMFDAVFESTAIWASEFEGASMISAVISNVEAGRSINQRADFGGVNMSNAIISNSDFTWADFTSPVPCGGNDQPRCNANLAGVRAIGTDFSSVQLQDACLLDGQFQNQVFSNARFDRSYMRRADFDGSMMNSTDFIQADIRDASFRDTNLAGADFNGVCYSTIGNGLFDGANLQNARVCQNFLNWLNQRSDYVGTPTLIPNFQCLPISCGPNPPRCP